ncbi:DUF397 domain-containing protein [Streptomyces canus]|uniref:DUF397 domain-containing protein n=1 Tax=Streptomyces canus TaxID=58343 RepID=UPI0036C79B4B
MREYDLSNARWYKSSYSNGEGGDCVEVAATRDLVPVRDSKLGNDSPVLAFPTDTWTRFLGLLK